MNVYTVVKVVVIKRLQSCQFLYRLQTGHSKHDCKTTISREDQSSSVNSTSSYEILISKKPHLQEHRSKRASSNNAKSHAPTYLQ
ncbi:hypothetical protein WN51_05195 [Melipona quadrifasciata]|uniref:Uncharacterized protein n=1 Tax=Melipona quadrifasciata TaxID=166423 RepID=A0A0M8ZRI2_9HYME|nr:hypothetical protein WN51_05195 [Melipona quadrifasciata]